ncbi:MAG: enoyl-CoA hydratase [Rhodospirillaceae bacterium]|nr:enoyl-CoA hydratase [Rhodospirillaceae bacterium]
MAEIETRIETGPEGDVAWVTIQNKEKANCLTSDLVAQLESTFRTLAGHSALRLAVLTGAGDRSFVAGANLAELEGFDEQGARSYITALQRAIQAIRDLPVPVVARVNGACMGAGLEVAIGCDIRIASDNARFAMPEVLFDIPSVIEAALLPRLIGWGRTAWMLYRGDAIDAKTALDWGLVESVVSLEELDAAGAETVQTILANGPTGVRVQKALMRQWERCGLDDGVMAGIDALAQSYRDGEPGARVSAFRNKK